MADFGLETSEEQYRNAISKLNEQINELQNYLEQLQEKRKKIGDGPQADEAINTIQRIEEQVQAAIDAMLKPKKRIYAYLDSGFESSKLEVSEKRFRTAISRLNENIRKLEEYSERLRKMREDIAANYIGAQADEAIRTIKKNEKQVQAAIDDIIRHREQIWEYLDSTTSTGV